MPFRKQEKNILNERILEIAEVHGLTVRYINIGGEL
jgi:hypothetical protein